MWELVTTGVDISLLALPACWGCHPRISGFFHLCLSFAKSLLFMRYGCRSAMSATWHDSDQQVVNNLLQSVLKSNAKVLYSFNPPPTQITSRWICFKAVWCGWAITTRQYKTTSAKHWLLNTPLHCITPTLYPIAFWRKSCSSCHQVFSDCQ